MCTYARINEFGFIETPYRKVKNGKVTNEIEYLTADQEENFLIAQANNPIDKSGHFLTERITAREKGGEFIESLPTECHYMDVSPKQLVSVAAGLIPFLEHDDANRALMGSNMQRQGVPLLVSEAPLVGTGLEGKAARDSRAVVVSEADGIVAAATAEIIVTTSDGKLPVSDEKFLSDPESVKSNLDKGIMAYPLRKFMRSNAGTCINQKPIVKKGQKIKKGQVLADGPNTEDGELAIGRNVLVAFMPWNGYNFEDAIVISEKVVKEDIYTSIHISEFDVAARDTKLGPEEITRDIPNVGEDALRNLDHDGIIRIGAEVKPGDILVGKITPKSETEEARRKGRSRRVEENAQEDQRRAQEEGRQAHRRPHRETLRHSVRREDPARRGQRPDRRDHHPGQPQDHQDAAAQAGVRPRSHRDRSLAHPQQDPGNHQLLREPLPGTRHRARAQARLAGIRRRGRSRRHQGGQGLHRRQAQAFRR
jgi:DNA-directed RNA polymerase subunit beta